MKLTQIKFVLLLSLLLVCGFAYSFVEGDTIRLKPVPVQKKEFYSQPLLIKSNPLAILWGPIPFTAEYRIVAEIPTSRTQSTQVGISYLGISPLLRAIENAVKGPSNYQLEFKGWRIQVAQRYYLISRKQYAPFGFYVSPNFSYSTARLMIKNHQYPNYNFTHFDANVFVGVQVGRNSRFTIDIFGGLGYKKNKVYYHSSINHSTLYDTKDFGNPFNSSKKITIGFNFGWAI